ncbi:hypothetical protein HanXRQr2_Chr14g0657481 [Helianthus annuus]|uniref:Uncharacterized protein n=1 Tax=Helianthus annuus TaxID=4232 RepID=A0A9K3H8Z1_HELAN|nr:hypothetical protein HanXRQr2_Chr14g0657481 [Helianthus annuus]KAJ0841441.1 hypothetical protein HanPSC8_Chr14g0630361 [Helianthus annuus]
MHVEWIGTLAETYNNYLHGNSRNAFQPHSLINDEFTLTIALIELQNRNNDNIVQKRYSCRDEHFLLNADPVPNQRQSNTVGTRTHVRFHVFGFGFFSIIQ